MFLLYPSGSAHAPGIYIDLETTSTFVNTYHDIMLAHPFAIRLITQPGVNKLQNVDYGIIPSRDSGRFRNSPVFLLDSRFAARVDPEHPRLR